MAPWRRARFKLDGDLTISSPSKEGPVMESWTAAAIPALVAGAIILYLFAAATL